MSPAHDGMTLRPLAPGDEADLLRIHAAPEVARWWDEPDEGFPGPTSPRPRGWPSRSTAGSPG